MTVEILHHPWPGFGLRTCSVVSNENRVLFSANAETSAEAERQCEDWMKENPEKKKTWWWHEPNKTSWKATEIPHRPSEAPKVGPRGGECRCAACKYARKHGRYMKDGWE